MSGIDYRTVRKDDLERFLVKYRSAMDRYISAVKNGGDADARRYYRDSTGIKEIN